MTRRASALEEEEKRVKHEVSLYAHITSINFTSVDQEVKGIISKTKNSGDMKTFSFDTRKLTKYQIANQLWDALDK